MIISITGDNWKVAQRGQYWCIPACIEAVCKAVTSSIPTPTSTPTQEEIVQGYHNKMHSDPKAYAIYYLGKRIYVPLQQSASIEALSLFHCENGGFVIFLEVANELLAKNSKNNCKFVRIQYSNGASELEKSAMFKEFLNYSIDGIDGKGGAVVSRSGHAYFAIGIDGDVVHAYNPATQQVELLSIASLNGDAISLRSTQA